jgi:tape measure domain-containing protein
MGMNADAMLRVAASVSGQQSVRGLVDELRKIGRAGDDSKGGVDRLRGSLKTLGDVGRAVGIAGLAAGLTAYGAQAIQVGEQSNLLNLRIESLAGSLGETGDIFGIASRAAKEFTMGQLDATTAVTDLYGRLRPMGVTTQQLETTFIGVNKAVRLSGLSAFDAKEAFQQLGQAMGSGRLQGDELRSLMERIPRLGQEIVNVFNDIRSSGGITLITKAQADEMVKTVKEGEKRQTQAMEDEARNRRQLLEDETDDQLRALARRYDRIRTLSNDANTDQDRAEEGARQKRLDGERTAIEERFDLQRRALEREIEERRNQLSDSNLGEQELTRLRQDLEDQQRERQKAIESQQKDALDALQSQADREATLRERQLRDQRKQREDQLSDQQLSEEKIIRDSLERRKQELDKQLNAEMLKQKKANEEVILGILSRTQVTVGELKDMGAKGMITTDIMLKAMERLSKLQIPGATELMKFNKAFQDLNVKLGQQLLPALTPLIERITKLLSDPKFTTALADLIKNLGEVVVPLIVPLMEALNSIIQAFASLPPGVREAIVKIGVMIALLKGLGAIGVLGGLLKVAGVFKDIIKNATGASKAIQMVNVRDITAQGLPGTPTRALPPVGGIPSMKPPPPGMFAGFMAELGRVGKAFAGLLVQVGKFGGAMLREVALAIPGLGRLGAAFAALRIGATISGWLGALAPFSQLAIAAVTPFLAWMTGTLLPALVGIFSGPVGWIALGVAALVAGVIYFREPIMGFLGWALGAIGEWWTKVFEFIYATQIEPWVKLWNADLLAPIRKALGEWLDGIKKFFTGIIDYVNREWMKPWTDWWINLGKQPEIFLDRVRGKISDLIIFLTKGMQSAAAAIQAAFNNAGQSVARIWNWITRGTANGLNVVIDAYNAAAASANRFPGLQLPILQRMAVPAEIPALARGGHMMAPTLAVIGEGDDPQGEYAIPGSRMDAAMAGWAQGLRGQALVNSWQNPGLAPGRSTTTPAAPATINLTLQQQGPTLQMPDGSQWVTRQEMATTTQAAMEGIMRLMRSGPVRANLRIR